MAVQTITPVELDFDKIKSNLKSYLQNQSIYSDFDFSGSGLNFLLDALSYNAHFMAQLAHLSINEGFLDSAQIRANVVSRAKALGYVPRSCQAATTICDVIVQAGVGPQPYASLDRGTKFTTVVDSVKYSFVNLDPMQTTLDAVNGRYVFSGVTLKQGTLKRMLYRVDGSVQNQKFEIPDADVDMSTLRVRVKSTSDAIVYDIYTKFETYSGIDSTSQVYFVQENSSGLYEVYFGDGVLGKAPSSNNVVELEYVYTDADAANGARAFVAVDQIAGTSNVSVQVTTPSFGGAQRESIDSIRFLAPFAYVDQNRAVTADDYKSIIQRTVGNIESIAVWGGEIEVEPDYGKVYIAIKPTGADSLSQTQKDYIIGTVLKGKNIVSITPVIVDPEFTDLSLDVYFKYNSNLTDRTRIELQSLVLGTITDFSDSNLKKFDGVFRYSQLLRAIDKTDPSILNSTARVYMHKYVTPVNGSIDLIYASEPRATQSQDPVLSSSTFKIGGSDYFLSDTPISGTFDRQIYLCRSQGSTKVLVKAVGKITTASSRVVINGLIPDTTDPIKITLIPNSFDLAPTRNHILQIEASSVSVTGEVDTIAVAGSAGAVGYTTQPRDR